MAHEVKLGDGEHSELVRGAIVSQLGNERLDLWVPESTAWHISGQTLRLVFENQQRCQLGEQMLGADLKAAVGSTPTLSNLIHEVRFEVSPRTEQAEESSTAPSDSQVDATRQVRPTTTGPFAPIMPTSLPSGRETRGTSGSSQVADRLIPHPKLAGGSVVREIRHWPRFVRGESNEIAWAAANHIINKPGEMTPALFHGPSGVGKSLLVSGICEKLRGEMRLRRVVHLTSEQFLNDFTEGLRGGGLPMFRRKYRDVEVLVLEDIQFLAGKRSSLCEVKHTLDNLLQRGRQVVLTADRSLNDLQALGAELVARLRGGMNAPMFPLNDQCRYEILKRELSSETVDIDDKVIQEIATRVTGDGRVLSGIVKRLVTVASIHEERLSWESSWEAIADLVQATRPVVKIADIERVVCDVCGLDPECLKSSVKTRRISQPRMLAMFLARQYTPCAYQEIGQYFGKRRHSTVISAERTVSKWLNDDASIEAGRHLRVRDAIRHVKSQLQIG